MPHNVYMCQYQENITLVLQARVDILQHVLDV